MLITSYKKRCLRTLCVLSQADHKKQSSFSKDTEAGEKVDKSNNGTHDDDDVTEISPYR